MAVLPQDQRAGSETPISLQEELLLALNAENKTLKSRPHVSRDEHNFPVLEWWNGNKKITYYTHDQFLLKVWGPSMEGEMEEVNAMDTASFQRALEWLYDEVTS